MNHKVFKTIEKFNMLDKTNRVIVAVSGGADSVALLHFFLKYVASRYKLKICAAHFNHSLRGKESDGDEQFVKNICKKWGVDLFTERKNIGEIAIKTKKGIEEAGRDERYLFFKELTSNETSTKIATAHTLSDNIETVILNLTRGCGLSGLKGIPPTRDNIIRPFINVSRQEVEAYCKENNLKFVNDSSNFDISYSRNNVRLNVIPHLREINPNLENSFSRFFNNISQDYSYIDGLCEKIFVELKGEAGFNIKKVKNLPEALKNRVIIKILKSITNNAPQNKDIENFERLMNGNLDSINLNSSCNIRINNDILNINYIEKEKVAPVLWSYKASHINVLTEAKKTFIIDLLNSGESVGVDLEFDKFKNLIDMDNLAVSDMVFRNRRPGDVFSPAKRGVTKKLKKLFNELKISPNERCNLAILEYRGEIVWIDGIGVSEKYKINKSTKIVGLISEG